MLVVFHLINNTQLTVASILEALCTNADLNTRRASTMNDEMYQKLLHLLNQHQQLNWKTESCKSIELDPSKL